MTHEVLAPYADYWSGRVEIAGTTVRGTSWGKPGRYVFRYVVHNPAKGDLDGVLDPFGREFAVGQMSAFTLGLRPVLLARRRGVAERPLPEEPRDVRARRDGVRQRPRAHATCGAYDQSSNL